ncbi:MAG: hypothetical protein MRZ54_06640 [Clostridiales bacterium]|nr:hypothetical protein [Clostridiales bacterium]
MKKMLTGFVCPFALLLPLVACAQGVVREPMPLAGYQAEIENADPQKAYVRFVPSENPLYQMCFEDTQTLGWRGFFYLKEVNGVPFTINLLQQTMYDAQGNVLDFQYYTQEELLQMGSRVALENGDLFEFGYGFGDMPECKWVGCVAEGVDAKGNELVFHNLVELLPEMKPAVPLDTFLAPQEPEEGKPFIAVGANPNPVFLTEANLSADQPYWWKYVAYYENTGSAPFIVTGVELIFYNGDVMAVNTQGSAEALMDWSGQKDRVIEPGERWEVDTVSPLQDVTMGGLRLTGTDESGNEMSFVGSFDLLHEMVEP